MKFKCPNCSHKFPVTEDDVLLDYDVNYSDSEHYIWENLPLIRTRFSLSESQDFPLGDEDGENQQQ